MLLAKVFGGFLQILPIDSFFFIYIYRKHSGFCFLLIYLFILLFIFGCVGSSFLCEGFL